MQRLVGDRRKLVKPGVNTEVFVATLAQINAGTVLVPAMGTVKYNVLDVKFKVNGTFLTLTDVRISDNAATPVDAFTVVAANLTDGNYLDGDSTGVTVGAGFGGGLTAGAGIQIRKTGSAGTGGTDITVILTYSIDSGLQKSSVQ